MRPLSFRPIAVCIGARTAILHRCSHLAFISPAGIGVCTLHFSRQFALVLAPLCTLFPKVATAMAVVNSKPLVHILVGIDPRIKKPVLYSEDEIDLEKETGVRARIRPQFGTYGELMLKLTVKRGCSEKALQTAEIKAIAIIKFNWDNPRHYVEDAVQPPPYRSDEYVEDPVEAMIRFAQHGRSRFITQLASNVEPPRPPKRPLSPPNGDGGSNKKGYFLGPRHGQAEGEQYPASRRP